MVSNHMQSRPWYLHYHLCTTPIEQGLRDSLTTVVSDLVHKI
jgi:hypothetical protein